MKPGERRYAGVPRGTHAGFWARAWPGSFSGEAIEWSGPSGGGGSGRVSRLS